VQARPGSYSSDFGLLGEQSSPKMCYTLPWTPMNRVQNLMPLALSSGGEIRNRTNTQNCKQTVTNISTSCLPACVDNHGQRCLIQKLLCGDRQALTHMHHLTDCSTWSNTGESNAVLLTPLNQGTFPKAIQQVPHCGFIKHLLARLHIV